MKKVSILVPIYNVERYIERCAITLFEQTYANIEYIFVNDCTKDKSIEILQTVIDRYPDRKNSIQIINHELNRGIAAVRNTALNNATGEFIIWVDSDDYIEIQTIEKCINIINRTNADIVVYGSRSIYNDKETKQSYKISNNATDYICDILRRETSTSIWGKMYKHSLFLDNKIFAVEGCDSGEDYFLNICASYYAKKIIAIDEIFYNYDRTNDSSITHVFKESIINSLAKYINDISIFLKSKPDYCQYIEALDAAKLLAKVTLSISWGLSSSSTIGAIQQIKDIFPDVSSRISLPWKYQLVLFLVQKKWYYLLRWYVHLGMKLKNNT